MLLGEMSSCMGLGCFRSVVEHLLRVWRYESAYVLNCLSSAFNLLPHFFSPLYFMRELWINALKTIYSRLTEKCCIQFENKAVMEKTFYSLWHIIPLSAPDWEIQAINWWKRTLMCFLVKIIWKFDCESSTLCTKNKSWLMLLSSGIKETESLTF